jgi:hypothetical protein
MKAIRRSKKLAVSGYRFQNTKNSPLLDRPLDTILLKYLNPYLGGMLEGF